MLACMGSGRPDDEDEEADDSLNENFTTELHFGGGFIRKDAPTPAPADDDDDGQGAPGRRRSKKEA